MNWGETLRTGLQAVRAHRLRSGLTVLGILIGIATVVLSVGLGEGTKTTPIWVVRAMVEGECLGRGRGSTKKAARNEAAKEGLLALGIYVS